MGTFLVLSMILVWDTIQQVQLLDRMDLPVYLLVQRFGFDFSHFKMPVNSDSGGWKVILLLWRYGGCRPRKWRKFNNTEVYIECILFVLYESIDVLLCSSHWDKRTLNNEVMTYISRYSLWCWGVMKVCGF